MPTLRKPTIKSGFRGQTGNKFRVYIVNSTEGNTFTYANKNDALRTYNANLAVYKLRSKKLKSK
jgi:hypothetical protein